jgi:hypothetical protein
MCRVLDRTQRLSNGAASGEQVVEAVSAEGVPESLSRFMVT